MAYNLRKVFERMRSALAARPRTTLRELSARLGVERHTLEKAVRVAADKPFREFQREMLFAAAVEMLRSEPSRSIKEIAFLLGYTSPRAFARFVRKTRGLTPTQLRRQLDCGLEPAGGENIRESSTTMTKFSKL